MTMGGKAPNVLVTLTTDFGKILSALHHVKIDGSVNLSTGVSIAQLVLKHRQNKNQKQRIIVFVASPVAEDEETLVKLGKKLKKNNVAVDIIAFGSEGDMNEKKLEAFINTVNSSDNSHLVTIPPGPHVLSDILISSPIVSGGESSSGGGGFEFGVDPSLDPELALALRISMEEEKARQEKLSTNTVKEQEKDVDMMDLTEDEQIARALAMSMEVS
jgi:26S proteasome regulatory subunit N10